MSFNGRDIISIKDLSKEDILTILKTARKMEKQDHLNLMKGRILATLFYEPSTRTRLSFESAMHRIGGAVLGFSQAKVSSAAKGETIHDTIKMMEAYADVVVMRHPVEGAARRAAESGSIPIINAGDGANQHPTQTLLDLYTMLKVKGSLENLKIGFVGDLKYGRTVHSLAHAASLFKAQMTFISPETLRMPTHQLSELKSAGSSYKEVSRIEGNCKDLDFLYMTRVQRERFPDPVEYEKVKDAYVIDSSYIEHFNKDMKIMHPLPRVNEIAKDLDDTHYAIYFEQARNGIPIRQALLALVTGAI